MASLEKSRTNSYSSDLRWRMVWQVEALQLSPSTVAKNLGVDTSTVKRTLTTFNRTGCVDKADYPSKRAFRILTEPVQLYLVHLILDRPGIYLREMRDDLEAELGVEVTESAICKFLKKAGITPKRKKRATDEDSIISTAAAIVKAVNNVSNVSQNVSNTHIVNSPQVQECSSGSAVTGVSPGRAADIRGRSFNQLSTLKMLLDDGVLNQEEFVEQKDTILRGLRNL